MSPFEANVRALKARDPSWAILTPPSVPQGRWSLSRTGVPVVTRDGRHLHSAFDPAAEARRACPPIDAHTDVLVILGLGAGYLAEAARSLHPDLPVIVAEADPLWWAEVLVHRDLSALWADPFVLWALGAGPGPTQAVLEAHGFAKVQTWAWRPLAADGGPWQNEVRAAATAAGLKNGVNAATFARFSGLWLRNLARNAAARPEVRPLAALAGAEAGRGAVICAAGPSLGASLDWIAHHRERFVLVAVDTAWSALAARGLEADYLVVLDGQYWNARHVDRTPGPRTRVVTELVGPPRAFRLAPGRTYTAASSVPLLRAWEEARWDPLGTLPTGGSVATAAWSLAVHLGCGEVVFAGLDLAYPGGQTHVAGSQFEEALHRRSRRLAPAETAALALRDPRLATETRSWSGTPVASDRRLDLFRRWLSREVQVPGRPRAWVRGAEGAQVEGMDLVPEGLVEAWPPGAVAGPSDPVPGEPLDWQAAPRTAGPAWEVLEAFVSGDTSDPGAAWSEARRAWGPAWDAWGGRAWNLWSSFPSDRTLRTLRESVRGALALRDLWPL